MSLLTAIPAATRRIGLSFVVALAVHVVLIGLLWSAFGSSIAGRSIAPPAVEPAPPNPFVTGPALMEFLATGDLISSDNFASPGWAAEPTNHPPAWFSRLEWPVDKETIWQPSPYVQSHPHLSRRSTPPAIVK